MATYTFRLMLNGQYIKSLSFKACCKRHALGLAKLELDKLQFYPTFVNFKDLDAIEYQLVSLERGLHGQV